LSPANSAENVSLKLVGGKTKTKRKQNKIKKQKSRKRKNQKD
jgi:hypothetical protein